MIKTIGEFRDKYSWGMTETFTKKFISKTTYLTCLRLN